MNKCCGNCGYAKIDFEVTEEKVRCMWFDYNSYPDSFLKQFTLEMDKKDGQECSEFNIYSPFKTGD